MPAPGVTIEIDDQSQINVVPTIEADEVDRPIYMVVSSADKGPEEWQKRVFGQKWYDLYGKVPSFKRHGQALIQAANSINAGAYVTFKRVVAEDATLANIGVLAKVTVVQIDQTDASGNLVYTDNITGNLTTNAYDSSGNPNGEINGDATPHPNKVNQVNIEFVLKSVILNGNNAKLFASTFLAANKHTNPVGTSGMYPLFLIMDNGRGVSNKRFRIYRDDYVSRPTKYSRYFFEVSEDGDVLETIPFTLNPDVIESNVNTSLENAIKIRSNQVRARFFDEEFEAFTSNVSNLLGYQSNEYAYMDCIFGKDQYGKDIDNLVVASTPDLSSIYGIELPNGSNGVFGDYPIESDTWAIQVRKAFDGSYSDEIYDLDNNRIDCIFDANYPLIVKSAIEGFVNFREDCVFFRDMNFDINCMEDLVLAYDNNISRSKFISNYCNYYNIYDSYTRKEITVTVTYDLARLFVGHFINGRNRPFCGMKYGIIIPSENFVEGSLNFVPKHTPKVNQLEEADALRVNYCKFYDNNVLTMAQEYTSQVEYTQLSFLNNILLIQQIIKAIRVICPKVRYSFTDGDDFARYKEDINNFVIVKYQHYFDSISIKYESDSTYFANKVLYAVIEVKFRDFIQTEKFKIIAIN